MYLIAVIPGVAPKLWESSNRVHLPHFGRFGCVAESSRSHFRAPRGINATEKLNVGYKSDGGCHFNDIISNADTKNVCLAHDRHFN